MNERGAFWAGRPEKRHIAAEWQAYVEHVIPPGADPRQLFETRRAFFAGATGVLHRIVQQVETSEEITPEDQTMIADLAAEIDEWIVDVREGRA